MPPLAWISSQMVICIHYVDNICIILHILENFSIILKIMIVFVCF